MALQLRDGRQSRNSFFESERIPRWIRFKLARFPRILHFPVMIRCFTLRIATVVAAFSVLGSASVSALTKEQILEIAGKPHNADKLMDGLKIFSHARNYSLELNVTALQQDRKKTMTVEVEEKIVSGNYLVTKFTPEGAPGPLITVITQHPPSGLYLKSVLEPDGRIQEMVGTSVEGSRAISWTTVRTMQGQPVIFGVEQHTSSGVSWSEILMVNGAPQLKTVGKARKREVAESTTSEK
tara:strand:+ start:3637 stop:4353 length:717 start_codon:yes stop_codon:yes gene_type:complete